MASKFEEGKTFLPILLDPSKKTCYRGFLKHNQKSGWGYQLFENEKFVYEGEFCNGLFNGYGCLAEILFDQTTDLIYEGDWFDGKMHGHGRLFKRDKQFNTCVGDINSNRKNMLNRESKCDFRTEVSLTELELCSLNRPENFSSAKNTVSALKKKTRFDKSAYSATKKYPIIPNIIDSSCISFEDLKNTYNEFRDRNREKKMYNEIVNLPQYRARPSVGQTPLKYYEPNITDSKLVPLKALSTKEMFTSSDPFPKVQIPVSSDFYLYDGEMKSNLPDGEGIGYFNNDIYYYGKWKKGRFHGKGILMQPNCFSFEGNFNNGVKSGPMVYNNYSSGYQFIGKCEDNMFYQNDIKIMSQRQSSSYPVIYPIPVLNVKNASFQDDKYVQ